MPNGIAPKPIGTMQDHYAWGRQNAQEGQAGLKKIEDWYKSALADVQHTPQSSPHWQAVQQELRNAEMEIAAAKQFLNEPGGLDLGDFQIAPHIAPLPPQANAVDNASVSASSVGLGAARPATQPAGGDAMLTAALNSAPTSTGITTGVNNLNAGAELTTHATNSYKGLPESQALVQGTLDEAGATTEESAYIQSIAMLESNDMNANTDKNCYSIYNFSKEMVADLNTRYGLNLDAAALREPNATPEATRVMLLGLRTYGAEGLASFIRGGITGWKDYERTGSVPQVMAGAAKFHADPNSYYQSYFNNLEAVFNSIKKDPSLLHAGKRVEVNL